MDAKDARRPYPSDLTDKEWAVLAPDLPPPVPAAAPRTTDLREVVNATLYPPPNGCAWPAPPHDDSGHTWHHPDQWLFEVVEKGMVPPNLPRGHQSDMPAFGDRLSNAEIRAVLAYIKSNWSEETKRRRAEMLQKRVARNIK